MTPEDGWLLQRERAVAWLRVIFAVVAVAVIQLNPSRIVRFPTLSIASLGLFLFYSLIVLLIAWRSKAASPTTGFLTTCLDVIWIALIVFSTGGTRTPFFFYYSFPVITASARWGFKGSIPVAITGVTIYGVIRFTLAAEAMDAPMGIDTILVRSTYLMVLAYIFGYISDFEKKQNQRLLALSKTAGQAAALQERRRIMYELHDGILQSLATMILRLENCRASLLDSRKELDLEIQSMEELTRNSMKEIRQFLTGKDTQPLISGTLMEKLRDEMRFLHDGLGLEVILESEPEDLNLPSDIEREIYYVIREAITNVTRHSHASRTEIHLKQTDRKLAGSLRDNGVGFDRTKARNDSGLGLTGMEERIKKLGGDLVVKSSPGNGTKLSFVVPL